MSTATRVPETHELEGDDALNALHRTGRARLAKDSFQRFRAAHSLRQPRTAEGFRTSAARKRAELWTPATAVAPRQPRWRVSWRQQSWSSMSGLNHSDRVPSSVAGRPDPACSRLLGPVRCRCAA